MDVTFPNPKGNKKVTQKVTLNSAVQSHKMAECYLVTSVLAQEIFSVSARGINFGSPVRCKQKNRYLYPDRGNKVTNSVFGSSTLGKCVLPFPLPFCYLRRQKGNRGGRPA